MDKKEEELSIDFSKITGFFKGRKKEPKEEHHSSGHNGPGKEELSLNLSDAKKFVIKHRVFLLIIIAIFLASYFRMQTMYLPMTDEWAQNTVYNYYKAQIRTQIDHQYPNLPEQNKNALIDQQFQDGLKNNKEQIDQQIKEVSKNFKSHFQDSKGYTYMPDIDPYYFLRYARNYLDHGYIGDEIRNGTEWDNHMLAPAGRPAEIQLHAYLLAYLYKIMSAINSDITLMQSAGYFPVIFSALAVIPAFYIGRKLSNTIGGFIAAAMVAINPAFINRTLWGHANTNAYNITLPLFIAWMFLEALDSKDIKKQLTFGAIGGVLVGIYSFAWNGWWYVFNFLLAASFLYFIYLILISEKNIKSLYENKKIRNIIITSVIFLIASGIFVSLFRAPIDFLMSPLGPLSFTQLKVATGENLWPNVYTTVAELNAANVSTSISSIGGSLLFLISIIGIALIFWKRDEYGNKDVKFVYYAILMLLWYIGIFYASTKGIRFTMMLVPPFAFGFGTALGLFYQKATDYIEKEFEVKKLISGAVLILIFGLLFIGPARASWSVATHDVPIVNDAWFSALDKIRTDSQKNAIINSWWDFGHHFKYLADRAVTFDGASQVTPQAHWIGKMLLTDNEDLATGILRMLDCGGNNAFDGLDKEVNNTALSVSYIDDIVKLDKESAKTYLQGKKISDNAINSILGNTHCSPPEDYFITSEDMVGKAGVWAHFGSWDFNKAYIWMHSKNLPFDEAVNEIMSKNNATKQKAQQMYYEAKSMIDEQQANNWIAPWPSYAGTFNCVNVKNETIQCENGIQINLTTLDTTIPTQQGSLRPKSLVYKTQSGLNEISFNSTLQYSAALVPTNDRIQVILMDPALAKSTFTKLFYYEGYGLKHFEPFTHTRDITGADIFVWKVNWK